MESNKKSGRKEKQFNVAEEKRREKDNNILRCKSRCVTVLTLVGGSQKRKRTIATHYKCAGGVGKRG